MERTISKFYLSLKMLKIVGQGYNWLIGVILGLMVLGYFWNIGLKPIRGEEPRRALVAFEMEQTGNYVKPTTHGEVYYAKPPLYNVLVMGFYKLFDSYSLRIVRTPPIISLFLMGFIVFLFTRFYTNVQTATLVSLLYVLSADILLYFSLLGEIDLTYTLIVYLQVIAIFHYYQRRQYLLLFLVSYFFTFLGLLTKGLPSLPFQAFTLLALFIYERKFKMLFFWQHIAGILFFVALTSAYFFSYHQYSNVAPYLTKLFTESAMRTALHQGWAAQIIHIFTFPLTIFKIMLPGSLLLLFLVGKSVRKEIFSNDLLRFSLLFVVSNIWVYWFSPDTRDRYIYMFLPFLLTILVHFYVHYHDESEWARRWFDRCIAFFLGIFFLVCMGTPFIQYFDLVPHLWWVTIGLLLFGGWIAHLFSAQKAPKMLVALLLIVAMKFWINGLYVPLQAEYSNRQSMLFHTENINNIVQKAPVYLTGKADMDSAIFRIQGKEIVDERFEIPPFLPREYVFYIVRENGHLMYYQREEKTNTFYITKSQYLDNRDDEVKRLYEFTDFLGYGDFVLYKIN